MVRAAALIAALVTAQPSAGQFDLQCAGQITAMAPGGEHVAPYSRRLRIDLQAGQWCADACSKVEPIARVEPSRLLLRDVKTDSPREYWIERESVDRVTGAHSSMATNSPAGPNPRSAFSAGSCEKQPFSGFEGKGARF